ncbi:MAG: helix-turn-helix domain-containing protein [Duodenibacillus sp.]|nr:helix-turn-helix domain-containing protein [Duodenibacillus sp.]
MHSDTEASSYIGFKPWMGALNAHFKLNPAESGHEAAPLFAATVRTRSVGDMLLGSLSASAYTVNLAPSVGIAESLSFVFPRDGCSILHEDGRSARARPGEMLIFNNARPAVWEFPQRFDEFILRLPRRAVETHFPFADRLAAVTIPVTGSLRFVLDMFSGRALLASSEPAPEIASRAEAMAASLLGAALMERCREAGLGLDRAELGRQELLRKARLCILGRLGDPGLTPEAVAAECGVSVRLLHKAWSEEGGSVMRWVLEERLKKAGRLLASMRGRPCTVAEIACACGFRSAAHFAARFRERTGETPSQYAARKASGPALD